MSRHYKKDVYIVLAIIALTLILLWGGIEAYNIIKMRPKKSESVRFGMTKSQVIKNMLPLEPLQTEDSNLIAYRHKLMGREAKLYYYFDNGNMNISWIKSMRTMNMHP